MRVRASIMVAALAIMACGGTNDVTTILPPTPVDSISSLALSGPTSDTIVGVVPAASFSAVATSSQGGSISFTWTRDGSPLGTGSNIYAALTPGKTDTICVTASVASSVKSACTEKVFVLGTTFQVVAANATSETLGQTLTLTLTKNGSSASCTTDSSGLCTVRNALVSEDSVRFVLDAGPNRKYHPMIGYLASADITEAGGVTLIAIPFQYAITAGVYIGQVVPTDMVLAYTAGSDSTPFYIRGHVPGGGDRYQYRDMTYPASSLPLPVNIVTVPEKISDAGVATIQLTLDSLKKILGWNITQVPVVSNQVTNYQTTLTVTMDSLDSNGVPITAFEAAAGAYVGDNGSELTGGVMTYFRESGITPHLTFHEMLHVLDFGHGCAWHSVMNEFCDWFKVFPDFPNPMEIPTATDVGYVELMFRIRDLERKYHTCFSLGESHQGERVLMLGLQEEFIIKTHSCS
jgi:hypothetical protein